jgi:hypothetical protein
MALRYWLNVNGGAKNDKSGSPSGHSLQSQVCTYSFIVAVPLKGILSSPAFCFWSGVSGSVAVSCALTWRRPAREQNYKKNKRTRYL